MDKNTVLLRDTEAFMRGELDNVTVAQNSIVLDLVQGSYVPYGCYTSAPLPMPLFDALRVSWNAASPDGTAVEAQCRVLVDGNWTQWVGFGKWSPCLHREGVPYQERGPVQRWHDHLQLDSKCATMVQLRIYLYTRDEKASPLVTLLGASTHVVDVIPARGRPVNARMHMMPYAVAHRAPALRPWMDLAIALASLTNRWGADLLPEEFAQVLRDWRAPDDHDPRSLSFAAAAAARWGFPAWVAYGDLALLRAEARAGYGAVVVDDGSTMDRQWIFAQLEALPAVVVLHHPQNRGKGAALKTAFQTVWTWNDPTAYLVTMDADGQHLPQDAERVLQEARTHPGALVLGTRTFGRGVPLRSRVGNALTRVAFHLLSRTKVADTQTGLRALAFPSLRICWKPRGAVMTTR